MDPRHPTITFTLRMPTSGTYSIVWEGTDRVVVRLSGEFEVDVAERLEREFQAALDASASTGRPALLIDLSGLEACSIFARSVLKRVQETAGARVKRTAYFADASWARGLAQWVIHLAEDDQAKSVATRKDAEDWLASQEGRLAYNDRRMNQTAVDATGKR